MTDEHDHRAVDEAAAWHVLMTDRALTPEERQRFDRWQAEPGRRAAFDHVRRTWALVGSLPRPAGRPEHRSAPGGVRVARGLAVAASIGALAWIGAVALDLPLRIEADAYTATGETEVVPLPDGSTAHLNTASAMEIAYTSGERRIRLLRGEAVFDVEADPARPFVVEAGSGDSEALGTVWSVRIEAGTTVATVLEGSVAVAVPAGAATGATVSAGEQVRYSAEGVGAVETIDADAATAWRRGKLIFVDRRLGDVVRELNRYHTGRIQITDRRIEERVVSGVFDLKDPVSVLDSIETLLGLRSTRLTNALILLHD